MVEILDTDTFKVGTNNGTTKITIKKGWDSIANLEPGEEATVALANGKHGLHIAVWSKDDQPKIGEIEDEI